LAPTALRVAPEDLQARVRSRFAAELRRAGRFAQLCLLGAEACLDAAGGVGPLGILWATQFGAVHATRSALDEVLKDGEPPMPFTFIATQPYLAGALLAQRSHPVTRTACLYLAPDAWASLPQLAQGWFDECERVLVGWVEESGASGAANRSDWCLLRKNFVPGAVRCERVRGPEKNAAAATGEDWISRIAAWRGSADAPLLLRGAEGAWRFSPDG
ncbi:MAG TPA: hypothetical protein VIW78_15485, partial [Burkholderiales bacterium]